MARRHNEQVEASRNARVARDGDQVPAPRGRRSFPEEVRSHALREVAAGRTGVEVAREYGIHVTTISRWKREAREAATRPVAAAPHGPQGTTARGREPVASPRPPQPPRETGRYAAAFKEDVLAQVASGRKLVEVAGQYGVPASTIARWRRDAAAAGGALPAPQSTRPTSSGPSPIDPDHRRLVLGLKESHPNMGLAQLQNQLRRLEGVKLGRHMIGRILKEAGIALLHRPFGHQERPRVHQREAGVVQPDARSRTARRHGVRLPR